MLRVAVIVANKSEDIEVIVPVDLWRRAGLYVHLISVEKKKNIILSRGVRIVCDNVISRENLSQYNAIYLPGGAGYSKFNDVDSPKLISFLKKYGSNAKKTFMAMCSAVQVYGGLGLLNNNKATCYPGCESTFKKNYVNKEVVISKNFITGRSPGSVIQFSLAAISKLLNKNISSKIAKEIIYIAKI